MLECSHAAAYSVRVQVQEVLRITGHPQAATTASSSGPDTAADMGGGRQPLPAASGAVGAAADGAAQGVVELSADELEAWLRVMQRAEFDGR